MDDTRRPPKVSDFVTSDTKVDGQMFGKYELVTRLGEGGMAEVWKAKIRGVAGFERSLVIKRVLPKLAKNEDFVAMFVREAQLCSMLSHTNVVQVFELGELDGNYYLAMEYVRGRDLHALLRVKPNEPPPPGFAAIVGRDMCRALGYAHSLCDDVGRQLRIVHRDVSPSNVMIGIDGTIKLVDFGVAKALAIASKNLTAHGSIKGKLSYMAPEHLLGGTIDNRTDLFAAGIVVHEALTGRRLFKGDSNSVVESILSTEIPAPSKFNPACPPELDRIVMRALQRDPRDRYQNGDQMADDFESCVHQLKWGARHVADVLVERFQDEDIIARASNFVMNQADADAPPSADPAASRHSGELERHTARYVRAPRKTVPFVHDMANMGAWSGDLEPSAELVTTNRRAPRGAAEPKAAADVLDVALEPTMRARAAVVAVPAVDARVAIVADPSDVEERVPTDVIRSSAITNVVIALCVLSAAMIGVLAIRQFSRRAPSVSSPQVLVVSPLPTVSASPVVVSPLPSSTEPTPPAVIRVNLAPTPLSVRPHKPHAHARTSESESESESESAIERREVLDPF